MAKKKTSKKKKKSARASARRTAGTKPAAGQVKPAAVPADQVTPYPDATKPILEFEDKLDQSLGAAGAAPGKRGRGRPRKETIPEPEFKMDDQLIRQTVKMPFDLWAASQKVEQLKLTDPEAAAFALPVKRLLDYYLPNVPEIGIAWFSLAITSYTIMAARLAIISAIKKQKATATQPAADVKETGRAGMPRPPALDIAAAKFPGETEPVKI